jgi:hypothetical protein
MSRTISFFCAFVIAVIGSIVLQPAPAQAGTLGLTASIKGAGQVFAVEGGFYSCSATNGYNENVSSQCGRSTYEATFEAWVWLKAIPADVPAGNSEWAFFGWLGCDTTRVTGNGTECGVHSGSFSLDERRPTAVFVDNRVPSASITSGPAQSSRQISTSATFNFTSDDPLATFRCSLDSGLYQACTSPRTYSGLAQGAHLFQVYAVDPSGQGSPANAATRSWIVDTVAPTVTIIQGPPPQSVTSSTSASFAFSASEASQYFCRLDNAASYSLCGANITFSNLSDGQHTLAVFAYDGLQGGPTAFRTWTVDTLAPDTVVVDGPAEVITDTTPTFSFASLPAGDGVAYQCRLDGAAWGACSGPGNTHVATELAEGLHTFEVRASDAANNVDASPASVSFEVVTTAPDTTITRGPSSGTRDRTPTFKFAATRAGSTFACKLDDGRYRACTSPWTTSRLSFGKHTVRVRATFAGITDATPAQRSFKVVRPG